MSKSTVLTYAAAADNWRVDTYAQDGTRSSQPAAAPMALPEVNYACTVTHLFTPTIASNL